MQAFGSDNEIQQLSLTGAAVAGDSFTLTYQDDYFGSVSTGPITVAAGGTVDAADVQAALLALTTGNGIQSVSGRRLERHGWCVAWDCDSNRVPRVLSRQGCLRAVGGLDQSLWRCFRLRDHDRRRRRWSTELDYRGHRCHGSYRPSFFATGFQSLAPHDIASGGG